MDKLLVIVYFSSQLLMIESQETQHFAYSADVEDALLRRLVFEQQIRIEKLENDLTSVTRKLDTGLGQFPPGQFPPGQFPPGNSPLDNSPRMAIPPCAIPPEK